MSSNSSSTTPIIYKGRTIEINWRVYKGTGRVSEDFANCTAVKMFLCVGGAMQYVASTVETDSAGLKYIHSSFSTTDMSTGTYDLKAVWVRPRPTSGDQLLSETQINTSWKGAVFALTSTESEDNTDHAVSTSELIEAESFAQIPISDGLSAYEIAVIHGYTGTEAQWIARYEEGTYITGTATTYAASTSPTVAPTSGWTSEIPQVAQGSYLWTRTILTKGDGSTQTLYQVSMASEVHVNEPDGEDLTVTSEGKLKLNCVCDNLTTDDSKKILSAKQGKVLNDNKAPNEDLAAIDVDNLGDVHAKSIDLDELPEICGFPLFIIGTAQPDITPDFICQFYVDKTNGKVYIATGVDSAADFHVLN